MNIKSTHKIALFTVAVGKDLIYFHSVQRYFPYNKENFGQCHDVDYYVFTDRLETIDGIVSIPCEATVWPYTTLLKNNIIADYLDKADKWSDYSHIFFIDADFAIGDKYDFFSPEFVLVKPYWNSMICGGFYGGKTEYFKKLCLLFYSEIYYIYTEKLPVPHNIDEFYLKLFMEQYKEQIHLIKMDKETNTLAFYDNEDLNKKIRQTGERLFLHPYNSEGRANKTYVIDSQNKRQECIVNLEEKYIFNNYTYDFGRLLKLDNTHYRILWSKQPERRDVLNIKTLKIRKQPTDFESEQTSPVISVVMPTYNTPLEYLKESVESILKQTFADFELLIIDDGSTETQGIEWLETLQDPRIRLIRNPHNFIDSLNRGIAESRGKYIARMDADDIMMSNRLQVQYNFMEEHLEIDICGSWMEIFGIENRTIQLYNEHKQIISYFLLNNSMVHPTLILRKSSVCKDGTDLYKKCYDCAEDYKLWTDLAIKGLHFANIPEILMRYRSWEKQVTTARRQEMLQSVLKIQTEYAEQLMQEMIEKEEKFFDFFENLIQLTNENFMSAKQMLNIVYQSFMSYLHRND
jgi:glycosyltransferase involved in cell wall biosynthesis